MQYKIVWQMPRATSKVAASLKKRGTAATRHCANCSTKIIRIHKDESINYQKIVYNKASLKVSYFQNEFTKSWFLPKS